MAHNGLMAGHEDAVTRHLAGFGVTEREAEVLAAVAEQLRNREIAGRLHISVRTVESHVAALLRKLGAADRAALAERGAELSRAARTDAALPSPLTSLVGREGDACQITALLGAHRLVTLTGPAGVGKTRLALRVATAQAALFPDGARLATRQIARLAPETVIRLISSDPAMPSAWLLGATSAGHTYLGPETSRTYSACWSLSLRMLASRAGSGRGVITGRPVRPKR